MTTTQGRPLTVELVLADLQQRLAELGDGLDLERARDSFYTQQAALEARIQTIRAVTATIAKLDVQIAAGKKWRDDLNTCRLTLADELLAVPLQIRADHDFGVRRNLRLSLGCVDYGLATTDTGYA